MADYVPVQEIELEPAVPPQPGAIEGGDAGNYQPVNDNDLAPAPAAMPPQRGMKGMPSYSPGVIARLRNGDPVTNTLSKITSGFSNSYGEAFANLTAQDQDAMIKAGIKPVTPEEMGTVHGALRFYGQSLGAAASVMQDAVLSIFPGALGAIEQGATQAAKEAGIENPERVGAEAAGFGEFMATDAHVNTMLMSQSQYAEATRIVRAPGGFIDQRIGPVPSHAEVPVQAASVADHYGLDIAPAIQKAYDGGVLPAEIFHDAKTDPTILPALAEGKVPEAYPVSDWIGGQMAPEAAATTPPKGIELRPNPIMQGAAMGDTTNIISHDIFDGDKKIGGMAGHYDPDAKQIVVTQVSAEPPPGPAAMRGILRQLQDRYPDAKTITGFRESGAREGAGGALSEMKMPSSPAVPTRLRPIAGTGELTPMQLSQSVEDAVGKVFDEVPASRVAENAVQERAASKFADMDPERADQVAMYGATPPKNLLGQMVFNEVLRRAEAAGDYDKVRMLATQGAQAGMLRRFGQEVQAASRIGPEGDVAAGIQQVQSARTEALKAKGVDVDKAVNDEVTAAQTVTRQARVASASGGAWSDFIASITCRE